MKEIGAIQIAQFHLMSLLHLITFPLLPMYDTINQNDLGNSLKRDSISHGRN
jgi:hypothetical protein